MTKRRPYRLREPGLGKQLAFVDAGAPTGCVVPQRQKPRRPASLADRKYIGTSPRGPRRRPPRCRRAAQNKEAHPDGQRARPSRQEAAATFPRRRCPARCDDATQAGGSATAQGPAIRRRCCGWVRRQRQTRAVTRDARFGTTARPRCSRARRDAATRSRRFNSVARSATTARRCSGAQCGTRRWLKAPPRVVRDDGAATMLQGSVRRRNAKQEVQQRRKVRDDGAATMLQGSVRRRNAKQELSQRRQVRDDSAATMLQGSVRRRNAKEELSQRRQAREDEADDAALRAAFGSPLYRIDRHGDDVVKTALDDMRKTRRAAHLDRGRPRRPPCASLGRLRGPARASAAAGAISVAHAAAASQTVEALAVQRAGPRPGPVRAAGVRKPQKRK